MRVAKCLQNKPHHILLIASIVLCAFRTSEASAGTCDICSSVCRIFDSGIPAGAGRGNCGPYILVGQTCDIQCQTGYEPTFSMYCDSGTTMYPQCVPKSCPPRTAPDTLPSPTDGIANGNSCASPLDHGGSCVATCDQRYELDGEGRISCSFGTTTFSGTVCRPNLDQSDPHYNPSRESRVRLASEITANKIDIRTVDALDNILDGLLSVYRHIYGAANFRHEVKYYWGPHVPATTGRRSADTVDDDLVVVGIQIRITYDASNVVGEQKQEELKAEIFDILNNQTTMERLIQEEDATIDVPFEGDVVTVTASVRHDELGQHPSVVVEDLPTGLPCLQCDTPLLLADGETHVPISDLQVGDLLYSPTAAEGIPVLNIARTDLSPRDVKQVVELSAHSCGEGMPEKPIIITKNHAIVCEGATRFYEKMLSPEMKRLWTFPHLTNSSALDARGRKRTQELCHVHLGNPDAPLFSHGLEMESWDGIGADSSRPYGWAIVPGTTLYVRESELVA